jgi:hypothetical protein
VRRDQDVSGRAWLALLVLVAAIGWWYSPVSPRKPAGYERIGATPDASAQASPANASASAVACQLPSLVQPFEPPRQSPVPPSLAPFRLKAATLTPLAGFSIDARVLSRRDYRSDREAELSPVDLALGWVACATTRCCRNWTSPSPHAGIDTATAACRRSRPPK